MVNPLEAQSITKSFGSERVLKELSLVLNNNETFSILGRSGSGKTTLLKILAGLEAPDTGKVLLKGKDILSLSPEKREIVYLYQEALLFPHLNVFENIAFGLELRKVERKIIKERTDRMIDHLQLEGMQEKMPHQLSGGQKQRVSFGRALITNPNVLLLDEPFGNLDADTRGDMQQLFKDIAENFNITAVFVTHNIKEAILMGDRIAKLEKGVLKTFSSIDEFVKSGDQAIQEEVSFWKSISKT